MSEQAIRERSARRRWASVGSAHDHAVQIASFALPVLATILGAAMIIAPMTASKDVSFMLAKNNVAVAKERMRLTNAQYRGEDSQGRPFQISAGSAVQANSHDPIVMLMQLSAQIGLSDGPATLSAQSGQYNMKNENVGINGQMVFQTQDGYHMTAQDVNLDLKSRQLSSAGPVKGQIPLGTFNAEHLQADLATRTVTLQGHAHLHIDQRSGRGKVQ